MTKVMIFLHGKQADKDNPKYEIIKDIAKKKNAEFIGINALLPYKDGLMWFDRINTVGKEAVLEQFKNSMDYLDGEISKIIYNRGLNVDDIIFCGHSQGGFIAAYIGITKGAKEVITLCSDWPNFIEKPNIIKSTPIKWIESGKEDYLTQDRIMSYKKLIEWECNLKHLISPHSTHNYLSSEIPELV